MFTEIQALQALIDESENLRSQQGAEEPLPHVLHASQQFQEPQSEAVPTDVTDPREYPKYSLLHSKSLSAEEFFFGIGPENAANSERLTVKVELPGEILSSISADTKNNCLIVASDKYYLNLPLNEKVIDGECSARWEKSKQVLTVSIPYRVERNFVTHGTGT